jgi:hypothetical protein
MVLLSVIMITCSITGSITGLIGYPYVKQEIKKMIEIRKLIEEIEDEDSESLCNMVCECEIVL